MRHFTLTENKNTAQKVIVVAGPTASGKTAFAQQLLKANPEFIFVNADSMQVYKEIKIGNNKDFSHGELFDHVSVFEEYSVADYQKDVRKVITSLHSNGKVPVLVGGSGLYITAAIYDYQFADTNNFGQSDFAYLSTVELQNLLEEKGVDIGSLNNSDKNNPRRLQNLLKKRLDGNGDLQSKKRLLYDVEFYILDPELVDLEKKLKDRVDHMFVNGLMEEVTTLLDLEQALQRKVSSQVRSAAGYAQVFTAIENATNLDLAELKLMVYRSHRQVAKKQLTWLKKYFAPSQ